MNNNQIVGQLNFIIPVIHKKSCTLATMFISSLTSQAVIFFFWKFNICLLSLGLLYLYCFCTFTSVSHFFYGPATCIGNLSEGTNVTRSVGSTYHLNQSIADNPPLILHLTRLSSRLSKRGTLEDCLHTSAAMKQFSRICWSQLSNWSNKQQRSSSILLAVEFQQ